MKVRFCPILKKIKFCLAENVKVNFKHDETCSTWLTIK